MSLVPRFPAVLLTVLVCGIAQVSSLPLVAGEWTAYNDSVDTDPGNTPENATNFGLGRGYIGDGDTGNLIDFATGADTGVQVSFVETMSTGNTINWAGDVALYPPGSDAEALFGGILDLSGNMSYNDGPGWHLDLEFSNLDPDCVYTFAATVHRNGGPTYANRITNWSIIGADTFTYASSDGAHKVSEASVEFSTGDNIDGHVARWTGIRGGADRAFTIRTTHGVGAAAGGMAAPDPFRGYAGGVFLLTAEPEGGPPFAITSIDYDEAAGSVTITWPAGPGRTYSVEASTDLKLWIELEDGITPDGDTGTFTESDLDVLPTSGRRYYRVIRQ